MPPDDTEQHTTDQAAADEAPSTEQLDAEAIAFARQWKAQHAPADGAAATGGDGATDGAAGEQQGGQADQAGDSDADASKTGGEGGEAKPDPLEEVERRARARQAEREAARAREAQDKAQREQAIANARTEGEAAARARLVASIRADMIATLEEIGVDPRDAFGILRDHAAHPERRRPIAPASQPVTAEQIAAELERRQLQQRETAEEQQQREAAERTAEARAVFADYVGGAAAQYPLLSDEDEGTRGRIGQMVAQDRARRGLSLTLDEIAKDAEQRLQDTARRKAAKIGIAGAPPAAAASAAAASTQQSAAEGDQGNAQAPAKPRTLTATMAAEQSNVRQNYPDGIAPIEVREAEALAEARQIRERLRREQPQ